MRAQRAVRGDKAVKVHLVKADPNLRTTGTVCGSYTAMEVSTTPDPQQATCPVCIQRSRYR